MTAETIEGRPLASYGFDSVVESHPEWRYLWLDAFQMEPVQAIEPGREPHEPRHVADGDTIDGIPVVDDAAAQAHQDASTADLKRWAPKAALPSSVPPLHAVAEVTPEVTE